MAVIRCPSCGKPNPDFLDICQYCDTPLHGPVATGPAAAQPAAPAGGDSEPDLFANLRSAPAFSDEEAEAQPVSELPDWLSRLGGPEAATPAQPANPPDETAGKISSWLDTLRSGEPEDQADSRDWYWTGTQGGEAEPLAAQAAAPAPADQLPDWLRAMDTAEPDQSAPTARIDEAGLPDWLQGVSAAATAQPLSQPPAAPSAFAAAPADELPDWLQSVSVPPAAPPAAASPFGAEPAEELPDWLQSASAAPAVPPAAASPFGAEPAEELPDWLQSASAAPAAPPTAASPFGAEPAEELPDWLQGVSTPPAAQPAAASPFGAEPAEELPDWLQGVSAAPAAQPAASSLGAEPAEELPDWLQGVSAPPAASPFGAGESQVEATAATADEMPDWLQSLGLPAAEQPESQPPASPFAADMPLAGEEPLAATPADSDQLPDWLRAGGTAALAGGGAPAIGEVPDWLQSFDSAIPEQPAAEPMASALPAEAAPGEAVRASEEELPDWLRSIGTGPMAPSGMPPAEARPTAWLGTPGAVQGGPAIIAPESSAEDQPEWLRSLGVSSALPEAAASPAALASDDQPEWLRGMDTAAPDETLSGAISPFGAGEATVSETPSGQLPDWLNNLTPAQPSSPPAGITGVHLAPVALPSWLEAMRPVDIQRPTISPEVDDYEETVGVLAGLRGVLRAQPGAEQLGKSAILVHKLEVTEAQTKQANSLSRTLAEASEAHPASKRSVWQTLPVARLAVFAVLFLALVAPLVFPEARNFFSPAPSWNQSAKNTFDIIDNLSPAQPALVVFDYDPAQAGELDPLAQALITHLQRRGVPVVGLSTSPTGAATGEALLNQIYRPDTYNSQYVNLGYLPGGPVGMLQMTGDLQPLLPVDFRGNAGVWGTDILTHTRQLSDFGVMVLVSATPETVRAWVEQLQSYPSKPKLIAAVSAGAEPLVRPYYENADPAQQQLKGLITGILGAAQYERQSGVAGLASGPMWDALGWGVLVVIVLLIGGNLFYGLAGVMRRQKR